MEQRKVTAVLSGRKVCVQDLASGQILLERGYGDKIGNSIELAPYEALYLLAEGWLDVLDEETGEKVAFKELLDLYRSKDRRIWARYLIYRDLRERGYVVKSGFGLGVDFRVYERGTYGKEAAQYIVYGVFEGEPILVGDMAKALNYSSNLKKEMILGVIERRGEIVYYSLSQFNP
ncbi:MAG: tRNA-intron lyase [Candidatus Bathyarchaeia archaeon]